MTEKFEIENEDIFEPEKREEQSFEELLEDVPAPFANYLKAAKQIVEPLISAQAPIDYSLYGLNEMCPPRVFKARTLKLGDEDVDKELTDLLNDGWSIGNYVNAGEHVLFVFTRLENNKEVKSNG